jgi:hypothetical protein
MRAADFANVSDVHQCNTFARSLSVRAMLLRSEAGRLLCAISSRSFAELQIDPRRCGDEDYRCAT